MSLLTDIGGFLTTESHVAGATGYALFYSIEPADVQDKICVVRELGGAEPPLVQDGAGSNAPYEEPDFQIMVRDTTFEYDLCRAKIDDIFQSLQNATITNYVWIFARNSPILLGYDDHNRPRIVQTFRTMRKYA
jgi:hypothetical protein